MASETCFLATAVGGAPFCSGALSWPGVASIQKASKKARTAEHKLHDSSAITLSSILFQKSSSHCAKACYGTDCSSFWDSCQRPSTHRSQSAPVPEIEGLLAPTTPPKLQQLAHTSPSSSPPRPPPAALKGLTATGNDGPRISVEGLASAIQSSSILVPDVTASPTQQPRLGRTGLLSEAFGRCCNSWHGQNGHVNTLSKGVLQLEPPCGCAPADRTGLSPRAASLRAAGSCGVAAEGAASTLGRSAGAFLSTGGKPQRARLPASSYCTSSEVPSERCSGAGRSGGGGGGSGLAGVPILPYDLSRSALWRVSEPRSRPPLPRDVQAVISCAWDGLSQPQESYSPVAALSQGGAASPFGLAWDADSAGGAGLPNPDTAGVGADEPAVPARAAVSWGGSSWTQQASPFAQLAMVSYQPVGGDEDTPAGGGSTGLPEASPRPASPGPAAAAAAGGAAACVGLAPMDDDELDDYYVTTLCGGVDPVAEFLQQELMRTQELAAARTQEFSLSAELEPDAEPAPAPAVSAPALEACLPQANADGDGRNDGGIGAHPPLTPQRQLEAREVQSRPDAARGAWEWEEREEEEEKEGTAERAAGRDSQAPRLPGGAPAVDVPLLRPIAVRPSPPRVPPGFGLEAAGTGRCPPLLRADTPAGALSATVDEVCTVYGFEPSVIGEELREAVSSPLAAEAGWEVGGEAPALPDAVRGHWHDCRTSFHSCGGDTGGSSGAWHGSSLMAPPVAGAAAVPDQAQYSMGTLLLADFGLAEQDLPVCGQDLPLPGEAAGLREEELMVLASCCCELHAAQLHPSHEAHLRRELVAHRVRQRARQQQRELQGQGAWGDGAGSALGSSDGAGAADGASAGGGGGSCSAGEVDAGQLVVELERVASCVHCALVQDVRCLVGAVVWDTCFADSEPGDLLDDLDC